MLEMPKDKGNDLRIGKVLLTQLGRELVSVITAPGVDGFVDYVKERWNQFLPKNKEAEQTNSPDA